MKVAKIEHDEIPNSGAPFAIVGPDYFIETEPDSFQAPSEAALAAIGPGDYVNLAFDFFPDKTPGSVMLAWFQIEAIEDGKLVAVVINDPTDPAAPFEMGEYIIIPPRHVLGIIREHDFRFPVRAKSSAA